VNSHRASALYADPSITQLPSHSITRFNLTLGFGTDVVLTALVLVIGRGTGIAIAAASGGSSSGAAWKDASAIAASLSALAVRPCCR
jgi:hypothetical protein